MKTNKISIEQQKNRADVFSGAEVHMRARPATSLRVDGFSKDDRLHAAYVDCITHMVPALADLFGQILPEAEKKPLAERSTDELIVQIDAGRFLAEIAWLWGVPTSNLSKWIAADSGRLMQAGLARRNQAALWDWAGLQVLLHAPSDRVEIARADKIARHCRWRAERFNRDDYGQKVKVTQVDERNAREFTTRELEIIAGGGEMPG